MRRGLLSFALLWLVLLRADGAAEPMSKKGKIEGESFVNLRSGPDIGYPSRAILRRGEEVAVEKEEGSWYLVALMDGRKGYVHKTFVVLLRKNGEMQTSVKNEVSKKPSVKEETVSDLGRQVEDISPSVSPHNMKREPSKAKPLPVITVLEGREWEILRWLGAGLCVFIIGWICGGNYYLRRDRVKRTKIHF